MQLIKDSSELWSKIQALTLLVLQDALRSILCTAAMNNEKLYTITGNDRLGQKKNEPHKGKSTFDIESILKKCTLIMVTFIIRFVDFTSYQVLVAHQTYFEGELNWAILNSILLQGFYTLHAPPAGVLGLLFFSDGDFQVFLSFGKVESGHWPLLIDMKFQFGPKIGFDQRRPKYFRQNEGSESKLWIEQRYDRWLIFNIQLNLANLMK